MREREVGKGEMGREGERERSREGEGRGRRKREVGRERWERE